jgi:tRNA (cmo5U34)-methyltransferase
MNQDSDKQKQAETSGDGNTERWEFNESVTSVFSDMLRRSIPQYEIMRKAVFDMGCRFVQPGTHILDLGCSRGDALAPFVDQFGSQCDYLGLEVSHPMLKVARARFDCAIESGVVRIEERDLRDPYPAVQTSVTLCVLTLQFVPIEYRQRIVRDIYAHTSPGGALILIEKILGSDEQLATLMTELYHELKTDHGYSREEVERKRLALEGVLVPVTADQNRGFINQAGFSSVDCFWRWMNFAGWIAVK